MAADVRVCAHTHTHTHTHTPALAHAPAALPALAAAAATPEQHRDAAAAQPAAGRNFPGVNTIVLLSKKYKKKNILKSALLLQSQSGRVLLLLAV